MSQIKNEILVYQDGTCMIVGPLAHRLYFRQSRALDRIKTQVLKGVDALLNVPSSHFVVDQSGTIKAAQSSLENALTYLTDERILIRKAE